MNDDVLVLDRSRARDRDRSGDPEKPLVEAEPCPGFIDPFRILSPEERRRHLDAYQSHLEALNGSVDVEALTLSRREAFFSALESEPLLPRVEIDADRFYERLEGRGRPEVDERTLWLLTVARANEGESYGVALELGRFIRQRRYEQDRAQLYMFMEEQYHSRLLEWCCRAVGLKLRIGRPGLGIRLSCRMIYYTPDAIRNPMILCSEALATAVFRFLLDRLHLFAEQPEVEQRMRRLLLEILRDEVLHVAFLRARMGPLALRVARRMLPLVVPGVVSAVPELAEQGCTAATLLESLEDGVALTPGLAWVSADRPARS